MDPDTINCVILRIHVDKNNNYIIPSHAIQRRISVSARYGSKKKSKCMWPAQEVLGSNPAFSFFFFIKILEVQLEWGMLIIENAQVAQQRCQQFTSGKQTFYRDHGSSKAQSL